MRRVCVKIPARMRGKVGLLIASIAIAILTGSNLVRSIGVDKSSTIVHGTTFALSLIVFAIALLSKNKSE
jgi:hypothetical protein